MTQLIGNGYGDCHNWENKGTESMPIPWDRSTLWVCKDCHAMFRHYYHNIPDIRNAMKDRGIKDECKPERTE